MHPPRTTCQYAHYQLSFFWHKISVILPAFLFWPCSHYLCHCSHWISNQQKDLRIIFPISGVVSLLSMTMTHNTVDQWRWRSGDIHHRDINICSAAIIAVQWLHFEKTEDFEQLWSVSDWTSVVSWEVEGKKIALRAFLDKRSCGWHGSISKIRNAIVFKNIVMHICIMRLSPVLYLGLSRKSFSTKRV